MKLGDYQLHKALYKHARANLFLARSSESSQLFLIKVLNEQLASNQRVASAFIKSAQTAQAANHPSIVRLHGHGVHKGLPYCVMDYVPGDSLEDKYRTMCLLDKIYVLKQVAEAIQYLNEFDLHHGNLHPRNVLLHEAAGRVLLADFGFSYSAAFRKHNPHDSYTRYAGEYLSSEQLQHSTASPHSDVYSLGMMLYAMVAGEPLIKTIGSQQPAALLQTPRLQLIGQQQVFEGLILGAIHPDATLRFKDVGEFLKSLAGVSDEDIIRADISVSTPREMGDSNDSSRKHSTSLPSGQLPKNPEVSAGAAEIVLLPSARGSHGDRKKSGQWLAAILSEDTTKTGDVKNPSLKSGVQAPIARSSLNTKTQQRKIIPFVHGGNNQASNPIISGDSATDKVFSGHKSERRPTAVATDQPAQMSSHSLLKSGFLILILGVNIFVWGWASYGPQLANSKANVTYFLTLQGYAATILSAENLQRIRSPFEAFSEGLLNRDKIISAKNGDSEYGITINSDTIGSVNSAVSAELLAEIRHVETLVSDHQSTLEQLATAESKLQAFWSDTRTRAVAETGLQQISQHYLTRAQHMLEQRRLGEAADLAHRAKVVLTDASTDAADHLLSKIDQRKRQMEVETRIQALLERGEYQLNQDSVLYPGDDNAVLTFRQVLDLHPHNPIALQALSAIKQRALEEANGQMDRGELLRADALAARIAIFFDESDQEIQQLFQRLEHLKKGRYPNIPSSLNQA